MNTRSSLLKDLLCYLPAQLSVVVSGLAGVMILTRLFTPEEYGRYAIAMATVAILGSVLGWVPVSIIRFHPIHEARGQSGSFCATILLLTTTSVLLVLALYSLALAVFFRRLPHDLWPLLILGGGVFAFSLYYEVFQDILRSKVKVAWYSAFAVWRNIAGLLCGLALIIVFGFDISGMLWGAMIGIALILPLLWRSVFGGFVFRPGRLDRALIRELFTFGFPLVLSSFSLWFLNVSDRYIIEIFRGSHEVGIYSAAYAVAERSINFLVVLFLLAFSPISIRIWERDGPEATLNFTRMATRVFLLVSIPLAAGISVLAGPLIRLMTSADFQEGFAIIPWVAAGILFFGLQHAYQSGFIYHRRTGFITMAVLAAGILNVVLNVLFIPDHGYFAAAVTTLVSFAFLTLLLFLGVRSFFNWRFPLASLARSLACAALMGLAVHQLMGRLPGPELLRLALAVPAGAVVYGAGLLLVRELTIGEVRRLLSRPGPPSTWYRN